MPSTTGIVGKEGLAVGRATDEIGKKPKNTIAIFDSRPQSKLILEGISVVALFIIMIVEQPVDRVHSLCIMVTAVLG